MKRVLPIFILALPLAACSWGIRLDSGGEKVRTAWTDDVSACRNQGKITVSVLDRVGPLDRNSLKVRDELEVMARNEAVDLGADTIKPLGDPRDGQQSWGAFHCGTQAANRPATRIEQRDAPGAAETYPIQNR